MFESFETHSIQLPEGKIFLRAGGKGQGLLLLHGYPQTHVCWHAVAPELSKRFFVVVPDLPGYGMSEICVSNRDQSAYSKRSMAAILAELMNRFDQSTFHVVGHDRGARVGYRMCLDYGDRVASFASLDVLPTIHMWDTLDRIRAFGAFHWTFLAQPSPLPETLINANPDYFHRHLMESWAAPGFEFNPCAMKAYLEAMRDEKVIRSSCEDYRAGIGIDVEHDTADFKAGNKIRCPLSFLWGAKRSVGGPSPGKHPREVWQQWCLSKVTGGPLDCGHFLPEEKPKELIKELLCFLP